MSKPSLPPSYVSEPASASIGKSIGASPMQFTAVLIPAEEGGFVALNPETGTSTQGESIEEALSNLQEATELYLEEFPSRPFGKPLLTTFEVPLHAA